MFLLLTKNSSNGNIMTEEEKRRITNDAKNNKG